MGFLDDNGGIQMHEFWIKHEIIEIVKQSLNMYWALSL
jgi:hypothetical protein